MHYLSNWLIFLAAPRFRRSGSRQRRADLTAPLLISTLIAQPEDNLKLRKKYSSCRGTDELGTLDELAHDKYGIAWTIVPQTNKVPGLKPLALAAQDDGPYITPSRDSFQDRSYPLVRNLYIYLNRKPGTAVDPKLKEFLRYVLSRDGQQAVADNGSYLPLPAAVVRDQLKKLD